MVMDGYIISITTHNHFVFCKPRQKGVAMTNNPKRRIEEIDNRLEQLPKGTLTYKIINGKKQPYVQRTIDGKSVSYYVKLADREHILIEFDERKQLQDEKKHLISYLEGLSDIYYPQTSGAK